MGYIQKYKQARKRTIDRAQGVLNFIRLPELKVIKTCGFIVSILL